MAVAARPVSATGAETIGGEKHLTFHEPIEFGCIQTPHKQAAGTPIQPSRATSPRARWSCIRSMRRARRIWVASTGSGWFSCVTAPRPPRCGSFPAATRWSVDCSQRAPRRGPIPSGWHAFAWATSRETGRPFTMRPTRRPRTVHRSQIERHRGFPSDSKLMSSSLRTSSNSSIENS